MGMQQSEIPLGLWTYPKALNTYLIMDAFVVAPNDTKINPVFFKT